MLADRRSSHFTPPPNYISRPRLLAKLDEGAAHSLTLVSAAAGWGKTALLHEWASGCPTPVIWVSLDPADNTASGFVNKLTLSLHQFHAQFPEVFSASFPAEIQMLTSVRETMDLLRQSAQNAAMDFVLVLDDYQFITDPEIHDSIKWLIFHMPPTLHLFVAGRTIPSFSQATLRVKNALTEIFPEDLRFCNDEIEAFVRKSELDLPEESVRSLTAFTEGWIVCLQLIQLRLRQLPAERVHDYLLHLHTDDSYLWDYLNEILHEQSDSELRQFMLITSILPSLHRSLCDAVLEREDSDEYLRQLEAFCLILPLDKSRHWYIYPAPLRDFLTIKLDRKTSFEKRKKFHSTAREWYELRGDLAASANQALAAGELDHADRLMAAHFERLDTASRSNEKFSFPWLRMFLTFSDDTLLSEPEVCLQAAHHCIFSKSMELAERPLRLAEAAFQHAGNQEGLSEVYALRSLISRDQRRNNEALAYAEQALFCLPDSITHKSGYTTATAALSISSAYLGEGRAAQGAEWAERSYRAYAGVPDMRKVAVALSQLASAKLWQGKLQEAEQMSQTIIGMQGTLVRAEISRAYIFLGQLYYEWNKLDAARECFTMGLRGYESMRTGTHIPCGYSYLADILSLTGDAVGSRKALDQALACAAPRPEFDWTPYVKSAAAKIALYQGNLVAAAKLLGGIPPADGDELYRPHRRGEIPARMRLLLERGRASRRTGLFQDMQDQLTHFLAEAEERGCGYLAVQLRILQALALYEQDARSKALDALKPALEFAEPEGFVRVFICEGKPMRSLLTMAQAANICPDYSARLLQEMTDTPCYRRAETQKLSVDQMTAREVEILKCMAKGMSTAQLAEKFTLSEATVRTHIRNIFAKLGVHSRIQAVEQARSLGLLAV